MVAAGPLLAIATFAILSDIEWLRGGDMLRPILLLDFVYALIVAVFVARRVAEMIAERRRQSAGSRLHMRLVRFFTAIALIPTILVAVFATITLNYGLEGWFSDRVRNVVANSMEAAEAYEQEHLVTLQTDARELGEFLNAQKERYPLLSGGDLRDLLTSGQTQMQRALPKAYVIDGDGELRARGERSYLFWYKPPSPEDIARARTGETVVIQDWENNEFWALLQLDAFADHFLYVSREVDGKILGLARRHPGDRPLLPAARGRPRPAALRVRAGLPRIRGGRHPGGDVDGALVRRTPRPAGRAAGGGRRARRARRPRRPGARRARPTTRSRCSGAPSTR